MRRLIYAVPFVWLALVAFVALVADNEPQRASAQGTGAPGLNVSGQAINRSTLNVSPTITTGLTYQQILPSIVGKSATTIRQSLTIENNNISGTDICYIIIGTNQVTPGTTTTSSSITINGQSVTAAQASITLGVGGSYQRYFPYVPADAIYATCATTGDSLYVDTQ